MSRGSSTLHARVAFLVGVRRSGTNWLRRIVDAHPAAAVIPGETYLFSHGLAPLAERVQHGIAGSARTATVFVDRDEFLDGVRDLCDRIFASHLHTLEAPVQLLAERTPDHVRHLDLIASVYPEAPVVHIIRDGRDVARSLVSQPWGPTDHADAAREWVSGIGAARRSASKLSRYLEVSYEALLADPVRQVPALYRFLGLDDGDDVVRRALDEAAVPYNVDPSATALTTGKWRGGLAPDELGAVIDVAGEWLVELGYEVDPAPAPCTASPAPAAPGDGVTGARAAVAGRLAGLRRRVRRHDDAAFQRQVLDRFDRSMVVIDRLLADVAARRFAELGEHFTDRARIRVAGGAGSWDDRGAAAVRRLTSTWAQDPALAGRQVRGDVHPGVPAFTIVSTWWADHEHHDRVLVVTCYGDRIDELTWYVLPREPERTLTAHHAGDSR